MEHYEACLEAVNGPSPPEYVLLSEKLFEKEPEVWEQRASNSSSVWVLLDKKELDRLSTVSSSSGLCGVFSVPNWRLSELLDRDFFLIAWELQDPGNVGTLIRSCAALTQGVSIFVGGCSPWSSKVARASAGALLKHPVVELSLNDGLDALKFLSTNKVELYSTSPRGGAALSVLSTKKKQAVLLGHESRGLPQSIQDETELLTINMSAGSESLNVAVAGSLACYERSRVF